MAKKLPSAAAKLGAAVAGLPALAEKKKRRKSALLKAKKRAKAKKDGKKRNKR